MEEISQVRRRQANFAMAVAFLSLMAAGLATVFGLTVHAAVQLGPAAAPHHPPAASSDASADDTAPDGAAAAANAKTAGLMVRLAWVSAAMLALTVVLLFWLVIHRIRGRFRPIRQERTLYVDAWALAGQRAKPIDEVPLGPAPPELPDEGEEEDQYRP